VYRGPVKRVVAGLGLESSLKTAYSRLLGSVSDADVITHEIGGISAQFHVSTGLEVQRFRNLMDETAVVESLLTEVTEDDVLYDIGANVGLYTCFLANVVDQTVAFEPHPINAERLEENIELNSLSNVTVRSEALSDTDGTAELAISGAAVAGEGTHALTDAPVSDSVEVKTVRGASLRGELPQPDVLKIDVEGAEMAVLRGCRDILKDCRLVYCETHPDKLLQRDESVEAVIELLEESGFDVEPLEKRETEQFLRAWRPTSRETN
jgi:FkbM family methyltransferase